MANAVVTATACAVAKTTQAKIVPNISVVHTPPPTGIIPIFYSETKNTGRKH